MLFLLFAAEAGGTGGGVGDFDEAQGEAEHKHRTTRELQPDAATGELVAMDRPVHDGRTICSIFLVSVPLRARANS